MTHDDGREIQVHLDSSFDVLGVDRDDDSGEVRDDQGLGDDAQDDETVGDDRSSQRARGSPLAGGIEYAD